jgi:peptide/nickel transport system permease protein
MEKSQPISATATSPGAQGRARSRFRLPGWLLTVLHNRKAVIGLSILIIFVFMGVFAVQLSGTDRPNRIATRPHLPPSAEHVFGTTRAGQDVWVQMLHGARTTMAIGFIAGTIIIIIAAVVGITAGYLGGVVDEVLSFVMNVFLVLPALPLIIVVAGWLEKPGPVSIILVLSLTSWAYGARVLRSQTLSLRNSEFVAAARISGEPTWRIVAFEILPNMVSLAVSAWIGAVLYAILTESGLAFIGLGDSNTISWGSILYWAQQNQALLVGAWWTFIPPGLAIALVGLSLTLINYSIDEITNPRLKGEGA